MSSLSSRQRLLAGAFLLLLVTLAAWFLVVSPKRAEAARLGTELSAAQARLAQTRLEERSNREKQRRLPALRVLKRALPDEVAMARIVRELNTVATASGLRFTSIVPGALRPGKGFQVLPITVEFEGDFPRVASFLTRLRQQVELKRGKTRATGRLYVVEALTFAAAEKGLPSLKATLTLDAFVNGSGAPVVP